MFDREAGDGGWRGRQVADRPEPGGRIGPAWLCGWAAVLALALWLSQLTAIWLIAAVGGSVGWTIGVARRRDPVGLLPAVLIWLAIGLAAGVQYRLGGVVHEWADLQYRIEERSAEALGAALDELLEGGELAVAGAADVADRFPRGPASRPLFEGLDRIQRSTGVSAIALFAADGSTLAWAGEHRGAVPREARHGLESYIYREGPLFSYLYFVRPLPQGVTATAAFLLDAAVEAGEGIVPFASRFERRYGARPRFFPPERAPDGPVWDWATTDGLIFAVQFAALTQQHWWERVVENGRRGVGLAGLAALLALTLAWYRARMGPSGVPVVVGTAALLMVPLGRLTGAQALFSPLQFVLPGPLDVTLGVLLVLLTGGALWLLTRSEGEPRRRLPLALGIPPLLAVFPLALALVYRSASGGLLAAQPAGGMGVQLAAALLIAVPVFLTLRYCEPLQLAAERRTLVRAAGYLLPAAFAVALLLWWRPGYPLPLAAAAAWALPAFLLLSAPRRRGRLPPTLRDWLIAGWLAGTASLAFLWPLHIGAELARAEREIGLLGTQPDPFLDFLLRQFAEQAAILAGEGETGVNLLYHSWVGSGLAREGYEARTALWRDGEPAGELNLSELQAMPALAMGEVLAPREAPVVIHYGGVEGLHYLLVAPLADGRTVSVAVPPRRRIAGATPLARFLHPEQEARSAIRGETLHLVPVSPGEAAARHADPLPRPDTVQWVRTDRGWRSETLVLMPEGPVHAHLVVATPRLPLLVTRAILAQSAILLALLGLWLTARLICRQLASVPLLGGGWFGSFRGRLSVALFIFFLLPTVVFGAVSYGAVAREVVRSAAALAQQALDQAAARLPTTSLAELGAAVRGDLLLYSRGTLVGATAPELLELGLFQTWLPTPVYLRFAGGEDLEALEERRLAESDYLVAYRRIDAASVLAAPIPLASHEITRRQQEFRDVALLVILVGLGLSVVLALLVSRALARPLDQLSRAAATVGAGNLRTRLPESRSDEFGSVYASFNRMIHRLRRTRAALVQETRRTETIVAEAATGVLALDADGRVELINPRAAEILGVRLEPGEPLLDAGADNGDVAGVISRLWRSPAQEAGTEIELDGRVVRLKLRRLPGAEGGGGAVVALEDVTAEVRTARVLAWGEVARQVAHEIKNPLTPIKLAVQHLRRAFLDERADFGDILDRNVEAILREIDRLGEISRAFSRFGTPAAVETPLEPVDVAEVVAEVLALYRGAGGATFRAEIAGDPLPPAVARVGEMKEVLVNLLENARVAVDEGGEVTVEVGAGETEEELLIAVADSGVGIPEAQLPRIFEPHFSTRSSGTGLGLAIVRRIVDSWGGHITVTSAPGAGTRFEIRLRAARTDVA
jgi:two-component system, NtrC family, nitrogen regulation sensor histidine kinase NtrY